VSNKEVTVGLVIKGDATGGEAALDTTEKKLRSVAAESAKVKILEGAVESVKKFESAVVSADAKVSQLQSTLSEAYNSDADAPLIRKLEKELGAAEKAAARAEVALNSAKTTVVDLNLRFADAGITTGNLAAKKAELAAAGERLNAELRLEAEYQAYLRQELERVAKAEKEVAAATQFEAQRQTAIAYQKNAEYAGWWATELDKVEQAEREVAVRANSLNASFATLGIRSAKQIEAELLQINQELVRLAQRGNLSGAEFDRAFAAGQARIAALKAELKGTTPEVEHVSRAAGNMASMMAGLAASFSGLALAREFVIVNVELENIERTFKAVTGSSRAASQELEYARDVADRLGLAQISTARAYADLMAATKGTAVEGKATREVFESVARAMSLAGRSSAETQGSLLALQQMANKGVIQMEELRGQLGERLPGALKAAADGLGITTEQLVRLTENGMLTAEELFPALAKGLNKLYADTDDAGKKTETLTQKWEHFKNGVADAFKTIGDNGGLALLKGGLESAEAAVVSTSVGVVALGKTIGVFLAGLASGDIGWKGFSDRAKQAFAEIEKEAQDSLVKVAKHNSVLEGSFNAAERAALAAARANDKAAAAAKESGDAARQVSADWTKLNVAYGELEDNAAKASKQSEAHAEARKAEAEAVVASAKAFGTETEKLKANEQAGMENAAATAWVASRRKEELEIFRAHLVALNKEIETQGFATEQQKKTIDTLQKTVEARQTDSEKADQQAAKARIAAVVTQAEAEAYKDNSARLGELKTAYEQAQLKVEALRAAKEGGAAVTAQLTAAEDAAGKAALLYRDALKDQTAAIESNAKVKQSQFNVEAAGIRLAIEQARSQAEVSKAYGDEAGAAASLMRVKQLEIELAALTAKAKRAEADAALAGVKAKRDELRASGELTAAKEAELKAQEAGAEVKKIEAQIAEETASRMRDLAAATDQSAASAGNAAGGYDGLTGKLREVGAAADDAAGKVRNLNSESDGVRNVSGSALGKVGGQSQVDFTETLYRRGGSVEEVKLAQKYVAELYARNQATMLTGNLGNEENASRMMQRAINDAVDKALAAARQEKATGQAVDLGTSVSDLEARNLAKTPLRSLEDMMTRIKNAGNEAKSQVVKIDLRTNGKKSTINVADQDSADALTGVLRQLESDAKRAS